MKRKKKAVYESKPALVTSLSSEWVVDSLPVGSATVDEQSPSLVGTSQKLLVLLRVYLINRTPFHQNISMIIFLVVLHLLGHF